MRSKEFNPMVSFPLSDSNSKQLGSNTKESSTKKKGKTTKNTAQPLKKSAVDSYKS